MSRQSKRLHPELFPLRHFRRVFMDSSSLLPGDDDFSGLFRDSKSPLLLGHYSLEMIHERLEHYGVSPKLREEGLDNIHVRMDTSDSERQQVFLYIERDGTEHLLGEISLHDGLFMPTHPFAFELRDQRFFMLYIQWLCLQNPTVPFHPGRPALPGQSHPGLKVGHEVMAMLIALAERMKMSGLINIPEFPHAAVLYSERFRYFNPSAEGRLRAMRRDLAAYTLAQSSWGILRGCVHDIGTGEQLEWFREEQVLPLSKVWTAHFKRREYREAVRETFENTHYAFDDARWHQTCPLNPDGSPPASELESTRTAVLSRTS